MPTDRSDNTPPPDPEAEVIAFLRSRSAPCPRCRYDLRDLKQSVCPECGEPLVLKVGSPRVRFGWMVLAMAPGCFSGVAAVLLTVPIMLSRDAPWPLFVAVAFGFCSAGSVVALYRHRHRFLAMPDRRQAMVAGAVWFVHIAMFAAVVTAMILVT